MITLWPGNTLFNRFEILEFKGGGGQSFGYHALDTLQPVSKPWLRHVFIKQFHDLVPGTGEAKALDRHFAALRERLGDRASYICLPIHLGCENNSVIGVFPWNQGMTLEERLDQELSREEAVRLAMALTKSVRFIHNKGVAHLDLKLSNVVIKERSRDGRLYLQLIDLDASRIDGTGLRERTLGTPFYASPEHFFPDRVADVSDKSDVFTLGIMLAEILTGRHPFAEAEDYPKALLAEEFIVDASDLHEDVAGMIRQCLRVAPQRRPTAGWVQHVLTDHYPTLFRPTASGGSSTKPARMCLRLDGAGATPDFRRTYYESTVLDTAELRGARTSLPSGPLVRLSAEANWFLVPLTSAVQVHVDGVLVQPNVRVKLREYQELTIGSSRFALRLVAY
jgi:serine/threonine protein kinase